MRAGKGSIPAEEGAARAKVEKYLLKTEHAVAWDAVVGNEAAREALIEVIEHPVKHKDLYAHYGIRPSRGVLLYGPPGNGKTMLGKAAASALARLHGADVPLIKISGPEIQSMYVGQTEETIRDIFAYARLYARRTNHPLVVFMDEADALLPSRDGKDGRGVAPWEESQVAQFLSEMDGMEECGAFVILATNRPHAIDAAVLRDGRCDRKVKVRRPDRAAAEAILALYLTDKPLAESVELLARAGADALWGRGRWLAHVHADEGCHELMLHHVVSGALLRGVVQQGLGVAFKRDLAEGGRSGLRAADLEAAVDSVYTQQRGLDHTAAAHDMLEELTAISTARSVAEKPKKRELRRMH